MLDPHVFFNVHPFNTLAFDLLYPALNQCIVPDRHCEGEVIALPFTRVAIFKMFGVRAVTERIFPTPGRKCRGRVFPLVQVVHQKRKMCIVNDFNEGFVSRVIGYRGVTSFNQCSANEFPGTGKR